MRIKSIRLSGYLGVPPDEKRALVLNELGPMSVLIGPNNAGKSTVIRFISRLRAWLANKSWTVGSGLREEEWWMHDTNGTIQSTIAVTGLESVGPPIDYLFTPAPENELHLFVEVTTQFTHLVPLLHNSDPPSRLWQTQGPHGQPGYRGGRFAIRNFFHEFCDLLRNEIAF